MIGNLLIYKNISPSIIKFIDEANDLFSQKPYKLGAKKSREIFAKHSKSLEQKRNNDISVVDDFFKYENREVKIRIYKPNNNVRPSTGMIYIHGGGWIMGDLDSHDSVCVDLSIDCNVVVISIDYSLSPEHPYPIALNQCFSLYLQYLNQNFFFKKLNLKNILIAGDSAGGNLSAALNLKIKKENLPLPKGLILIYPCLSLDFNSPSYIKYSNAPILDRNTMIWFWKNYLGKLKNISNPIAIPELEKDLTNLPDTIICTAEIDPLASDGIKFVKKLKDSSVNVSHIVANNLVHGFIRFREVGSPSEHYFQLICKEILRIIND